MIKQPNFASRPTKAIVSLKNLAFNYRQIRKLIPKDIEIWGIVKANAYGHGLVPVSKALEEEGVNALGVATLKEGEHLRENSLRTSIYVLDGILGDLKTYSQLQLIPVIHTLEELQHAIHFCRQSHPFFRVSLKFDTGMGRLGLFPDQVSQALTWLQSSSLDVDSVVTHLARADESVAYTEEAYQNFHKIKACFQNAGLNPKFSICNSASILDQHFDKFSCVRPGIALYGAYPHERQHKALELKPVLEWVTKIVSLKNYKVGMPIGYGGTFVTKRPSRIAMLPLGYADGYPRLISNRGEVSVRGQRAPIVGRISMDLMAIDVTDISGVEIYDEVTLIGKNREEEIRVEEVAKWAETISYEILTGIQERVPREYV